MVIRNNILIILAKGEYLLYSRSSPREVLLWQADDLLCSKTSPGDNSGMSGGNICYIVDHRGGGDLLGGRSTIWHRYSMGGGSKFYLIPTLVQVSAHVILKSLAGGDMHEVSVLTARSKSRIFLSFNNCICFLWFNSAAIGDPRCYGFESHDKLQCYANMKCHLVSVSVNQLSDFPIKLQSR